MEHPRAHRLLALALAALVVPACSQGGGSPSTSSKAAQGEVPDFHLQDLNPISATHDRTISPRDYLGRTPAFYFTHAN